MDGVLHPSVTDGHHCVGQYVEIFRVMGNDNHRNIEQGLYALEFGAHAPLQKRVESGKRFIQEQQHQESGHGGCFNPVRFYHDKGPLPGKHETDPEVLLQPCTQHTSPSHEHNQVVSQDGGWQHHRQRQQCIGPITAPALVPLHPPGDGDAQKGGDHRGPEGHF